MFSASKFPGSPYLGNHLSDSIHTWTICSMPGGRDRGQNVVHLKNVVFLLQSFIEVHILTSTYQKAVILKPYIPCRVFFHSMTSDPRVHGQGWGSRSESFKCGTTIFLEVHNLTPTYQKAFILRQ